MEDLKPHITPLGLGYSARLTTITPLHIGSGNDKSPLGDYFINKSKILFLNTDSFGNLLKSNNQTDLYIKSVLNVKDADKTDFIDKFFSSHLDINLLDSVTETSYPVFIHGNPVELREFIKSDGRPFIPGSSLKGALRSALLFDWLFWGAGKATLTKWLDTFFRLYKQRTDWCEKGTLIEKSFKEEVEEVFYGRLKSKERRLAMSCLKVSDSEAGRMPRFAAYELLRYNLMTGTGDIPVLKECVDMDEPFRLTINIDYYDSKNLASQLQVFSDPQQLCDVVNRLSALALEYEMEVIAEDESGNFTEYADWLERVNEYLQSPGVNTCYLRLGQGKMQFYQTIAMSVFELNYRNEYSYEWIDYLKYCAGFPKNGLAKIYPVTRSLTSHRQMPLGWVKMEIS